LSCLLAVDAVLSLMMPPPPMVFRFGSLRVW
jgi:hypothetical protein